MSLEPVVYTSIETARLQLRRFAEADLPAFNTYRNDPDVARYQSWEGISEAEAVAFVRAISSFVR
jgi:RimJ/RimL family protein N-acetyltransferase